MDVVVKNKHGNLFKKEDVEDDHYVFEVPDQHQIFITHDQHLPEKALQDKNSPMEAVKVIPLEKTSQELTKELDDLKFRYKNLASQHAKDVYELEEMRTRLQYLLQQEFDLDQRISELQLK